MATMDIEGRFKYLHERLSDLENLLQHHVRWHTNQIDEHHKKQDDELARLRKEYEHHFVRFHEYY